MFIRYVFYIYVQYSMYCTQCTVPYAGLYIDRSKIIIQPSNQSTHSILIFLENWVWYDQSVQGTSPFLSFPFIHSDSVSQTRKDSELRSILSERNRTYTPGK